MAGWRTDWLLGWLVGWYHNFDTNIQKANKTSTTTETTRMLDNKKKLNGNRKHQQLYIRLRTATAIQKENKVHKEKLENVK